MAKPVRNYEKATDFKASIKKLLMYLKPYILPIVLSLLLVVIGTVFTLIGPNRISKVTDIIEKGISVNFDISAAQMDELEGAGSCSIKVQDQQMELVLVDDQLKLNIAGREVATVNYAQLKNDGYIELENKNFAFAYNEGLQLWINTQTKVDMQAIIRIGIILITIYVASYIANLMQGIIMAIVNQKVSQDLRSSISKKISKLPLNYFDNTTYGNVLSVITNDVDTVSQTLNHTITSLVGAITQFIGALLMMFITNAIMATAGIVAVIFGFVFMILIVKKSQKYFIKQQQVLGKVNGYIEEVYSGQEVIKAYNAEDETIEQFEKLNNELYSTAWKSQFFSGLMHPIMGFIGNFGYVVVCIVGALLVSKGVIGFAVIVAIMIYIRLFTQPLSQLAQATSSLQSTAAASERVFNFLEQEEMIDESNLKGNLTNIKGNVEFKHCKFGYLKNKIIIKDFSAKVKAGQKVAIVGPTGAGKTTLVNLLMKFYNLNDGDILIDGKSIHDLTREQIHLAFGMVLQDTWLFEASVKENIKYSKEEITDEEVVQACKACGIHHFIKTLPNGYDTILDENTSISAGQKQLLTIARAMVENAPMLILDEATSSVDTRTEILIQKAMDKLTENRTSFVIAHRLSTIKNADVIFVMKDGDIIEQGNHHELLLKNGFYAELYNSQFEEVE